MNDLVLWRDGEALAGCRSRRRPERGSFGRWNGIRSLFELARGLARLPARGVRNNGRNVAFTALLKRNGGKLRTSMPRRADRLWARMDLAVQWLKTTN